MPEVVTKYPYVLIEELKAAKGKCGQGIPPKILTKCPPSQFCLLPTGEICVYDLNQLTTMTQVSPTEWTETISGIPAMFSVTNLLVLIFLFGMGLVLGMSIRKK